MTGRIVPGGRAEKVSLWRAPKVGDPDTCPDEPLTPPEERNAADMHPPSSPAETPTETSAEGEDTAPALPPLITAEALEALQEAARQEGFEQGYADGLASGKEAVEAQIRACQALLDHLTRPLDELDTQVEQELLALAVAIARQLVRRELRTAPDEIVGVVKEALALLPSNAAEVKVELHPEDAALVRRALPEGEGEKLWRVVENPALTRGGCRVSTATGRIDASVEKRLNQVIAAALGNVRGDGTG